MEIIARAPLRVDFAGGWTDVPHFSDSVGGCVTAAAIAHFVTVRIRPPGAAGLLLRALGRDGGELHSIQATGASELAFDGVLDIHKAALLRSGRDGVEIETISDAPVGSGLGGSGALGVALLAGLSGCTDPSALAEQAFDVETEDLGLAGGRQDQLSAALGHFHEFTFNSEGVGARRLALDPAEVEDLESHTVIAYTGQSHFSSATHDRVWERFHSGEDRVASALNRMRQLAGEAASALTARDWCALSSVVDANWQEQQSLHDSIATDRTRRVENAARSAGAWGVKATGAGAGGCLLILGPADRKCEIESSVKEVGAETLRARFVADGVTVECTE